MKKLYFLIAFLQFAIFSFAQTDTNYIAPYFIGRVGVGGQMYVDSNFTVKGDTIFNALGDTILLSNINKLNNTQIAFGINGKLNSNPNLTWNNTTKTLSCIGGGTMGTTTILDLKNGDVSPVSKLKIFDNGLIDGYAISIGTAISESNVSIGGGSGRTTAFGNIFVGANTGFTTTDGTNNIAIGTNSFKNNLIGINNIIIGSQAGFYSTASNNVFIGNEAGYGNIGESNTFVGTDAGRNNSVNNNTFIGSKTGQLNILGSSSVFLGYEAGYNETTSNKLYISNSNTTTPLIYGEFDNKIVKINSFLHIDSLKQSTKKYKALVQEYGSDEIKSDTIFNFGSSTALRINVGDTLIIGDTWQYNKVNTLIDDAYIDLPVNYYGIGNIYASNSASTYCSLLYDNTAVINLTTGLFDVANTDGYICIVYVTDHWRIINRSGGTIALTTNLTLTSK